MKYQTTGNRDVYCQNSPDLMGAEHLEVGIDKTLPGGEGGAVRVPVGTAAGGLQRLAEPPHEGLGGRSPGRNNQQLSSADPVFIYPCHFEVKIYGNIG